MFIEFPVFVNDSKSFTSLNILNIDGLHMAIIFFVYMKCGDNEQCS